MKKIIIRLCLYNLFFFLLCTSVAIAEEKNEEINSLADAFKAGRAYASFRYRFEHVDQDGLPKDAKASTLRTRLGFETGEYENFQALVEIEDVQEIGNDMFNNTINGKTDYPVVADPDGTEVNQAYLKYSGISDTVLTGGRKLLTLDDHRFVGDVGWRQNSQTFDAVDIQNTSLEDTKLYYAWVYQVNRIFGEDSDKGKFHSHVHLFNVKNSSIEGVDVTPFLYLMDLKNADTSSNSTFGLRANGKQAIDDDLNFLFDASYAHQSDYADNPSDISADFYHINGGVGADIGSFNVGYEVLGSDGGAAAFQTPLATLHKFNGWADMFLSTPDDGLTDLYVKLGLNLAQVADFLDGFTFATIFHDFNADRGSDHYGTEWDFVLSKKIKDRYKIDVHYAHYNAIDFASDTEKLWLSLSAAFST